MRCSRKYIGIHTISTDMRCVAVSGWMAIKERDRRERGEDREREREAKITQFCLISLL
jgi:hypothetical protein